MLFCNIGFLWCLMQLLLKMISFGNLKIHNAVHLWEIYFGKYITHIRWWFLGIVKLNIFLSIHIPGENTSWWNLGIFLSQNLYCCIYVPSTVSIFNVPWKKVYILQIVHYIRIYKHIHWKNYGFVITVIRFWWCIPYEQFVVSVEREHVE